MFNNNSNNNIVNTLTTAIMGKNVYKENIHLDSSSEEGGKDKKDHRVDEIRELSLLACRVPELTRAVLLTPSPLDVVNVVSSQVEEARSDALEQHGVSLARLSLAFNLLTHIPAGVANLTRLEVLDLRGNHINRLVDSNVFSRLHRLRRLHLDHNRLGRVCIYVCIRVIIAPDTALKSPYIE